MLSQSIRFRISCLLLSGRHVKELLVEIIEVLAFVHVVRDVFRLRFRETERLGHLRVQPQALRIKPVEGESGGHAIECNQGILDEAPIVFHHITWRGFPISSH